MKRETLIKNLQKKAMRITFTKVNGDERIMDCTLQEHMIPETGENNRKKNEEVLPVFDINKVSGVHFVWTLLPILNY